MSLTLASHSSVTDELATKDELDQQIVADTILSDKIVDGDVNDDVNEIRSPSTVSVGEVTATTTNTSSSSSLPSPPPVSAKPASVHSELRVVTNVAELEAQSTPSSFNSHGLMPSLSPLASSYASTIKSNYTIQQPKSSSNIGSGMGSMANSVTGMDATTFTSMTKDLQFDPRFLAEAWSQESPQSVYAWLAQPSAGMHSFSPLAVSPIGSRLMSPVMHQQQLHQQQQQLFQAQQSLFPSHNIGSGLGSPLSLSPVNGRMAQYFSSQTLPPSPHFLHGLPPVSSMTPSSSTTTVDTSDTLISNSNASSEPQSQQSPTTLLRQLLPPIVTRPLPLNAKELTMHELRPHFNKPMAVVAKELGVCITLMKKICRRNGLVRWPHRRIRSLVNRITSLQVIASTAAPGVEKKRVLSQIFALREELSAVIENPNEKSRKAQADAKIRSPLSSTTSHSSSLSMLQTTPRFFPPEHEFADEGDRREQPEGDPSDEEWMRKHRPEEMLLKDAIPSGSGSSDTGFVASLLDETVAPSNRTCSRTNASAVTGKRKGGYRNKVVPPPIKIPRVGTRGRRGQVKGNKPQSDIVDSDDEDQFIERPSSTGSNGKRGSISSILCSSGTASIVI